MTLQDIEKSENPVMRGSLAAMRRAALEARRIAIQTNTAIVIEREGRAVRVTAEELRQTDLFGNEARGVARGKNA